MDNPHLSVRSVAKDYSICHVTFNRVIQKLKIRGYNPHNKIFSKEQELQLVKYVLYSAKLYYGLTIRELRKLVYEYAAANNLKYPPNWKKVELASEDWTTDFLNRNLVTSLQTAEPTSLSRAMNFNKPNVNKYFDKLDKVLERKHFKPEYIYNVHGTGCTTVQKIGKVLVAKVVKQVSNITSKERGTLVTICLVTSCLWQQCASYVHFSFEEFWRHFHTTWTSGPILDLDYNSSPAKVVVQKL